MDKVYDYMPQVARTMLGPFNLGYQFAYAACMRLTGKEAVATREGVTFFYWFADLNWTTSQKENLS